jgi:hypothetical protein
MRTRVVMKLHQDIHRQWHEDVGADCDDEDVHTDLIRYAYTLGEEANAQIVVAARAYREAVSAWLSGVGPRATVDSTIAALFALLDEEGSDDGLRASTKEGVG